MVAILMRQMLVFLTGALLASSSATAASLENVMGAVLVNRGDGYKTIDHSAVLTPGHSVMAKPGGSARLVYDNGCVVEVRPGAVVAVRSEAPCASAGSPVSTIPHLLTTQAGVALIVRRNAPPPPVSP